MDFKKLATQYKDELMNHILPFWLECSQDHEYGGYLHAWIVKVMYLIRINLFGCRDARCGCFRCFIIRSRSVKSG